MSEDKLLIIKLAHHYHEYGMWDKAVLEYEKLAQMDPADLKIPMALGDLFLKKGDLERSYAQFESAAEGYLKQKNMKKAATAFRELASLIERMVEPQNADKAVRMYENILSKLPESAETLTCLRDLYHRRNQLAEAISYTLQLANLYNRLDYVDKAEVEYAKALEWDPSRTDIREALEKLRKEMNELNPSPKAGA